METRVSSAKREVVISDSRPTVLIGERINPTGKKRMAEALKEGNLKVVLDEARAQVDAGADILDINVVTPGVDEIDLLPTVVEAVMGAVSVPLCIDFNRPKALEGALKVYQGKPIVNSITGEEKSLNAVLPLVKEHGASVIALTMDEEGIPKEPGKRVEIAHKIVERAEAVGIRREDVIFDCLTLTVGADHLAGLVTLEAIGRVKAELGSNQTLGVSNISFGLPERPLINHAFLAMAILKGVTCPTVNVANVRSVVLGVDLVLGRDRFGQHYLKDYRKRQAGQAQ